VETVALPDDPTRNVTLVPYDPQFNFERGQWFFDIEIFPPAYSASTFVRLALARYQAKSADPSLTMSEIVLTDVVRLLPDRTATATRVGARYQVEVYGWAGSTVVPAGQGTEAPLAAARKNAAGKAFPPRGSGLITPGASPPDPRSGLTPGLVLPPPTTLQSAPDYAQGRIVEVELQEAGGGGPVGTIGDFSWTPIVGPVPLAPMVDPQAGDAIVHFKGSIGLPRFLPTGATLRLVVREREIYTRAPGAGDPGPVTEQRIVYTDVLPL
jgi:hypothetical protein